MLLKFLRDQDLFGHPVLLTFNNKGTHYNTSCGGFVSIVIKLFMLGTLMFLVRRLTSNENDTYKSFNKMIDF